MMRARTCTLFLMVISAGLVQAQQPNIDATIDEEVGAAMRDWHVPGVALVVLQPGHHAFINTYGMRDIASNLPVTQDTLFPLASCSKAFTTTSLAMLVSEGKIHWDDPVRKYLPDFHLADPNADALVTVRDLLCHRTGLGSHDFLWYRAPWSQDEMI